MCGVSGIIGQNIDNKELLIGKMTDLISHRGPDDQGFYVDGFVGLGMRRLSIIDLSSGRQPITSENDKLIIFFNGEIYNYKELRLELEDKKYKFKTNTDTEVILHMFEEYGKDMLTRLRGMFVFVIYNTDTKKLFIARDYFGIKPLYYLIQNEKIVAFSSEIKSFLSIPGFKAQVNDSAVYNYLSFQYNPLGETFFKSVYKLPPAHYLFIDSESGEIEMEKYWSFNFEQHNTLDKESTIRKIQKTITDSVEHHMIADVPVGSFLSGGIDSSIIATLMQKIRGDKKVKTYTVGFNTLTEGEEAKETSNFLETDHKEIIVGPEEYFSELENIVYHFDEPVADPSAVGLYFVAKEAKKDVKVVLSGEGSDELFGGYNIYLSPFAKQKMLWVPKRILSILTELPFDYFGKNYLKRVNSDLEEWYIGNASIFKQDEIEKMWIGPKQKFLSLIPLYRKITHLSESTQMQYIDINTWLVGDILAKADKMTMANSLELRVPFLDIEVSELAKTLPDKFKWSGNVTKYLLRESFKKIIPESTRNRKKLGFPTPIKEWLRTDSHHLVGDQDKNIYDLILTNKYITKNLNTVDINRLISTHLSGEADNSRKIFLLATLALWYNIFIQDNK